MRTQEKIGAPAKPKWRLARLSSQDLDAAYAFECSAFPKPMQASYQTLANRFALDHFMLGAWEKDRLIGLTSWRYTWFDLENLTDFPRTFTEFSSSSNNNPHNAAFVYNFAISPAVRSTRLGLELALKLISEGIGILISDQCAYLVGASRCPSYAGSNEADVSCKISTELRMAIEQSTAHDWRALDNILPWQRDPVLSFYKHALACTYLQALPAFMPEDKASGSYAISFYKELGAEA